MRIDLKMAWRNIWRNRRRSILTILAIAFACLLPIQYTDSSLEFSIDRYRARP